MLSYEYSILLTRGGNQSKANVPATFTGFAYSEIIHSSTLLPDFRVVALASATLSSVSQTRITNDNTCSLVVEPKQPIIGFQNNDEDVVA